MSSTLSGKALYRVFHTLLAAYGPQHWWPGDTPFEIMVGAILTQNTAWTNVERAIANLITADSLDPRKILNTPQAQLGEWLRPSGYFNVKARRLQAFCAWYIEQGGYDALLRWDVPSLRRALLDVHGIGPETADDILLYAFQHPVFVIDAYTRRLLSRLGLLEGDESYEVLRRGIEAALQADAPLYNEYHALIVHHAKTVCRPRPLCRECCLQSLCEFVRSD